MPPSLLAVVLCFLGGGGRASALVFTTANHDLTTTLWDTWLFKGPDGWVLNYLAAHKSTHMWNSVGTAVSADGAHFADTGISIRKECPDGPTWESQPANASSDCAVWLGSGSVWPRLGSDGGALPPGEEEWVINYSQQYNCGAGVCQATFFATSRDLVNWTPVAPDSKRHGGNVFQVDPSLYSKPGRWDTVTVVPRGGAAGYWGFWTANPLPSPRAPASSPCASKGCGAGFGWSLDGLNWTALPTPGPFSQLGASVAHSSLITASRIARSR